MRSESTRPEKNRSTKAVTALVLSVLLITSVVTPALAMGAERSPDYRTTVNARDVSYSTGASEFQQTDSVAHSKTESDAQVTDLSAESNPWNETRESRSLPRNATTTDVTLITGQTVTVVETENRTQYRVAAEDRMRKVRTPNATYVFPRGVDFSKFDKNLFDVEFLIRQNLTDAKADSIPVIVTKDESRTVYTPSGDDGSDGVLDSVAGTEKKQTLESIDAQAGEIRKGQSSEAYEELAADDEVAKVSLDVKYRVELTNTDDAVSASAARQEYAVDGTGVKVAVLDTGIDEDHPAIDKVADQKDFTGEGHTRDEYGHGTHVAGIVASDDETYTGMAPNASLMDVRVLGSDGIGYTSDIIDGMEYADNNGADIISMSLGSSATTERSNDPYNDAVDKVTENGTLVVISAGNSGDDYQTIGSPGIAADALTVGASDAAGWYESDIAGFSSRGPTPYGLYVKPDVVAPGVGVTSTGSADAGESDFVSKSGTSMAAPTVTGIAALVVQEHSEWGPNRVKSVITSTSDSLGSYDVYTQGAGEVNATDALDPKVSVSPGTIDFGMLSEQGTVNRTITVTNLQSSSVTLSTDVGATNIDTGDSAEVKLNQSEVTVPADGTAQLNLTVDTSNVSGMYSGGISLDNGRYNAIFGFTTGSQITIEKNGIGGTSTDDDFVWVFSENSGPIGTSRISGSSVTYNVSQSGTFHVFTDGIDEQSGEPIVVTDEFSASGSVTRTLDESDTVSHDIDTAEIEDESGSLTPKNVEINYATETQDGGYVAGFSTGNTDTTTVRFSEDESLSASVERLLVPSETGEDGFSSSDVYHLIHTVSGVSSSRTADVDPGSLTKKKVTYYRNAKSGTYNVVLSAIADTWYGFDTMFSDSVVEVEDGVGDRRQQTIYLSSDVGLHGVGASDDGSPSSWNLSTSYTAFHEPGETIHEEVNRQPYSGSVYWKFDDTGELEYFYGVPQIGQGYHLFYDDTPDDMTLTIGGETVADSTFSDGYVFGTDYSVSSGKDITLEMVGNNGATSLSTRTVTSYSTTYEPYGDNQPPNISSVDVIGLTTENTDGRTVRVRFIVDGSPSDVTAMVGKDASAVPFDGGSSNWKAMTVEKTWESDDRAGYVATYDPGEFAGKLDLAVKATDEEGNAVESTTFDAFRIDSEKPTMDVVDAGAGETPSGTSETIYTNETVTINFTADGTPADGTSEPVEFAGTSLTADFANFRTWESAERSDGHWTVIQNLSDLPDDGTYSLDTFAVDRLRNVNVSDSESSVVLDRDAPDLGATIEKAGNDGTVTLTSDESLQTGNSDSVSVTVEKPGNTEEVSLTRNESAGEYVWDGTFGLGEDGTYNVTATGADRTGNVGETTSTTEIETLNVTDREVTVVLEKSGLFIEFRTNETGFNSTVSVTESRSALAPLSKNLAGLNFLNGELGKNLTDHLDDATIGIPVNESSLPPGVADEQVDVGYYNPDSKSWELLDTTIEERTIDGETRTYWVTNVTHFSTYGAVADDQQAPTLDAKSPSGATLDYGTAQQTVTFNYSDDISGVDASAVELEFDGERVTDESETNITGEYARYNATGLSGGEHTAKVTVVDEAGNEKTYTTSFVIETDSIAPTIVSSDPGDGAELDSDTGSVEATIDFSDDLSGVNVDALQVEFDGSDVTDDATVLYDAASTSGQIEYTVDSLSAGSSHTLEVYLEDSDGNGAWYAVDFSVRESESSGGGGGGGGGGSAVPPPAVQEEVVELTGTYAEAKITAARSGNPGEVTFEGGLDGGEATFRALTVEPSTNDAQPRFFVEAESSESAPSGVTAFEGADRTLGYLTVTPTYIGDSTLETVGVTFGVDTAKTDTPKNVALYQYADGEWSEVETEFREERDGSYRFYAPADSTGTFAVGLDTASFEVTDAALGATEVAPGDSVTVSATVENVGTGVGTHTVELTVDGEVVATETVTLAAGESTTVEFDRTFDAGDHEVAIGSVTVGTVSASEGEAGESGMGDERNQQTKGGSSDSGIPGFGLPATLVALLAAMLFARRRE